MELEHIETGSSQYISLNLNDTEAWKAVVVTVSGGRFSLSSETSSNSSLMTFKPLTSIDTAVIGEDFAGLIQDVIIYTTPIEDFDFSSSLATFLPQCYCLSDSMIVTTDECIDGNKTTTRYISMLRI